MINKYTALAAIDLHITPHMFRHTFATCLLEADVDSILSVILIQDTQYIPNLRISIKEQHYSAKPKALLLKSNLKPIPRMLISQNIPLLRHRHMRINRAI